MQIEVAGARLRLLAQRAVHLPDEATLLVADAHLGKAGTFRRLGVPVPGGSTAETLATLSLLLRATQARRIVFLGDLLHSPAARAPAIDAAVSHWRRAEAGVELTLVRGNHDRRAGDPPAGWHIDCVDAGLRLGPLALLHHPEPVAGAYALAGHVHPAALLGGRANDRLRLPCFHFGAAVGVLPAFGPFTGMHVLPRTPADRVYVIAGDEVHQLPALNSIP